MSNDIAEQRPTYGSEEIRKLRETIASQARIIECQESLQVWGFHMQFNNGREATFKGLEHLANCEAHQEAGETITMLYTGPQLPVLTDRVH